MRKISVSEFSRYCKEKNPSCYIYLTDNQDDECYSPTMKATMRFSEVIISLKPDRICFANCCDRLSFERVKEIQMFDDRPSIGTVFNIVCMDGGSPVKYTMLAD